MPALGVLDPPVAGLPPLVSGDVVGLLGLAWSPLPELLLGLAELLFLADSDRVAGSFAVFDPPDEAPPAWGCGLLTSSFAALDAFRPELGLGGWFPDGFDVPC